MAETLAIFGYGATVMATVGIWAGAVETGAVVTVCIPITDSGESKSRAAGGMAPFGGSWKYSGLAGLSALESQLTQHFPQCQLLQHEVQAVNLRPRQAPQPAVYNHQRRAACVRVPTHDGRAMPSG